MTGPSCCPECGYGPLDAATEVPGLPETPARPPQPGDLSLCLKCTAFLVYDDDCSLVVLSLDQLRALSARERDLLHAARRAIHRTQDP